MSKLGVAEEAGNVVANVVKDAAGREGVLGDAARAAERLLDDAGGAVSQRPKTLSLTGDALAAAKERLADGGLMRVGSVRASRAQGNVGGQTEVFTKSSGTEGATGREFEKGADGITAWRAPDGAKNPFTGTEVKVTPGSGLAGIDSAATARPAEAVQAMRTPAPPPRELTLEERLPTKPFEIPKQEKTQTPIENGMRTEYKDDMPFKFTGFKGTPLASGEYVTTVAQIDAGPMKGWTTLHHPEGIYRIGMGPEKGSNYLGQTNPVLALSFQPKGFARQFGHLEEPGAPAFIQGDTTFLRTLANTGKDRPTTAYINPKGEVAGLQWEKSREMTAGPFTGLKGDEINVIDGKMRLIDRSETVGGRPKEYIYDPKRLGMENIQTWSEVPRAIANPDKAMAIPGVEDKVVVPQLLYPRPLMNIVQA